MHLLLPPGLRQQATFTVKPSGTQKVLFIALLFFLSLPLYAQNTVSSKVRAAILPLRLTLQQYHPREPWRLSPMRQVSSMGVLMPQGVLTSADGVAQARWIEAILPDNQGTLKLKVKTLDPAINLALLQPEEHMPDFFVPLTLAPSIPPQTPLLAVQLDATLQPNFTSLLAGKYQVENATLPGSAFLTLHAYGSFRTENGSMPSAVLTENHAVAGLMVRYESNGQHATLIPALHIERFLENSQQKVYPGSVYAGLMGYPIQDPVFSRYLNLPGPGGVYIGRVDPQGTAAQIGIHKGDVLRSLQGRNIDSKAMVEDATYGLVHFLHLITSVSPGTPLQATVWRKGAMLSLQGNATHKPLVQSALPLINPDTGPTYLIYGGLVFRKLDLPYLQNWGPQWAVRSPVRLAYAALRSLQGKNKPEINATAEPEPYAASRVVLDHVLPVLGTRGYQQINASIVNHINGQTIHSLQDVAKAFTTPINALHRIELDDDPFLLFLDPTQAEKDNTGLQQPPLRIERLRRLD